MYRYKILQNFCSKFKPKIRNDALRTFKEKSFFSVQKKNFYSNVEMPKFFKRLLLLKKIPSIKNSERYISQFSENTCWKCNKDFKTKNITCSACGALQPPKPNINYFELLGISQSFDVNLEEMTEKFRSLQMIFHPDKVENKSETEKKISETYSRLLNEAYKILRDPISRGFYILESKKDLSKNENPLDSKFLALIMEKNEELETIDNLNSLDEFSEANNKDMKTHFTIIQKAFHSKDYLSAKLYLLRLNYLIKLNEKIIEKQSKIRTPDDK